MKPPMEGLGLRRAWVIGGIGVGTDVIAIEHNKAPAFMDELIVTVFETHTLGHEGFFVVGHGKIMIAQYMIAWGPELVEDGAYHIEAGKVPVDEIAEVHHESEVHFVVVRHALTKFARGLTVFPGATGLVAILAISDRAKPKQRLRGLQVGSP